MGQFWVLQGLELLREYEYITVFDADFKPKTDFLVSNLLPVTTLLQMQTWYPVNG